MDATVTREALAAVGLEPARITPIPGGWANWTFDLDGELIARFPRHDAVATATRRELALLPALAERVSFAVPAPTHEGTWDGRPFFVYPRIDGRPLSTATLSSPGVRRLGVMLAELHAVRADRVLPRAEDVRHWDWGERYDGLWPTIEDAALPTMEPPLADRVRAEYERLLAHPPSVACLVHNDLSLEHILVDEWGVPVGLIDFEDAALGDPATDLMPVVERYGPGIIPDLTTGRDLGDDLVERMWRYWWLSSVHSIIYGVTQGVDEERVRGLEELRRRISAPPDRWAMGRR